MVCEVGLNSGPRSWPVRAAELSPIGPAAKTRALWPGLWGRTPHPGPPTHTRTARLHPIVIRTNLNLRLKASMSHKRWGIQTIITKGSYR